MALELASASALLFVLACLLVLRVTAYHRGTGMLGEAPCDALAKLTYAYPLKAPQDLGSTFESYSPMWRRCAVLLELLARTLGKYALCTLVDSTLRC